MPYRYFLFEEKVARTTTGCQVMSTFFTPQTKFEFYINGTWQKDEEKSLHLCDAMMDYGDYGPSDYDDLTEEQALELISAQNTK